MLFVQIKSSVTCSWICQIKLKCMKIRPCAPSFFTTTTTTSSNPWRSESMHTLHSVSSLTNQRREHTYTLSTGQSEDSVDKTTKMLPVCCTGLSWFSWSLWPIRRWRVHTESSSSRRSRITSAGKPPSSKHTNRPVMNQWMTFWPSLTYSWLRVTEHLTERNMPAFQPGTKVRSSRIHTHN